MPAPAAITSPDLAASGPLSTPEIIDFQASAQSDAAIPTEYEPAVYNRPARARPRVPQASSEPLHSEDGRLTLTDAELMVRGQSYLLLDLERVDVQPVKWLLYYLLGGLGLSFSIIAYLQNWLRTMPFAGLLFGTSLLLLLGWRGTNRLRLHRLGRDPVNIALPGEAAAWQRVAAEVNCRVRRAHDQAAAEAADLLDAADEATRQAAAAAQANADSSPAFE